MLHTGHLKLKDTYDFVLYPFYRWIKRFGEVRKPDPIRKHFKAICGIPEPTWAPCLHNKGMLPPSCQSNGGGIAMFIFSFMTSSLCADRKSSGTFPFEGSFNIDRHLLLNQLAKNKELSPWFLVSRGLINLACTDTSFLEQTTEPLPWSGQELTWVIGAGIPLVLEFPFALWFPSRKETGAEGLSGSLSLRLKYLGGWFWEFSSYCS